MFTITALLCLDGIKFKIYIKKMQDKYQLACSLVQIFLLIFYCTKISIFIPI